MTVPHPRAQAAPVPICPHCGGSGTLRLGGQRYRTCLPCLGQGRTPALQAAITPARLALPRAEAFRNATAAGFSAAVSSAAAR